MLMMRSLSYYKYNTIRVVTHVLQPYIFFKIDVTQFQKNVTIPHHHNLFEENVRF